jgi:hypothetical protein
MSYDMSELSPELSPELKEVDGAPHELRNQCIATGEDTATKQCIATSEDITTKQCIATAEDMPRRWRLLSPLAPLMASGIKLSHLSAQEVATDAWLTVLCDLSSMRLLLLSWVLYAI